MKVTIRRVVSTKHVVALNAELFPDAPAIDADDLRHGFWWVGFADGKPVAFAGIAPRGDKAFLSRAGVLPEARGAGLQRRLIRIRTRWAAKAGFKRVYTYTYGCNYASASSLTREGFRLYFCERSNGSTWLWWQKMLNGAETFRFEP